MWTDPEEARSDFILAAAAVLIGPLLLLLVTRLLPFLFRGLAGNLLLSALVFSYTALVPLLLARYRGQGIEAFGLDAGREGLIPGLIMAAPIAIVAIGVQLALAGRVLDAVLGTLSGVLVPQTLITTIVSFVVRAAGALLLFTFLTVKARDGFARNEVRLLEMLRTFGIGAAGGGFIVGVLLTARGESFLRILLEALTLVAIVLIADRSVAQGDTTSRATILAPAIVALVLGIDLFGGAFLLTLRRGLLAAGLVVVVAALLETRRHAWAVVPLLLASVLWATPVRPL